MKSRICFYFYFLLHRLLHESWVMVEFNKQGGGGVHQGLTDCRNWLFFGCGLWENCENTIRISEIIFKADDA